MLERDARSGIRLGAEAWLAYATLECVYVALLPEALHLPLRPLHPVVTLGTFLLYPLLGAGIGGTVVAFCRRLPGAAARDLGFIVRTATTLAWVGALAVVAVGMHAQRTIGLLLFADGVALATILVLAIRRGASGPVGRGLVRLANPWLQAAAVFSAVFLSADRSLGPFVAAAPLLALAAFSWARAARGGRAGGVRPLPTRVQIATLVVPALALWSALPARPVASEGRSPGGARPSVVVVTLDTVRADHLSLYGYERDTSPRLAAFAARGTICRHAFAPSDMTLATHASLFTGLLPSRHQAHYDVPAEAPGGRPIAATTPLLAEILASAGYQTAAVVSNAGYLGPFWGFARGFDRYDPREAVVAFAPLRRLSLRAGIHEALAAVLPRRASEAVYRNAAEISREALALVDSFSRERPFFLFVNFMDAHAPYLPPPPWDTRYPGKLDGVGAGFEDSLARRVARGEHRLTAAERNHLVSQYDGAIAFADDRLGWLLDGLDARGLLEDSLVVITSDHGEAFGEHGGLGHGLSVFQEQIGVPLVVKYPGQHDGAELESCNLVDVFPTVLETAGSSIPGDIDGRSLRLPAPERASRIHFSESFPNGYLWGHHERYRRELRAAIRWPHKLVVSSRGSHELYDLSRNEGELEPIEDPAVSAALRAALATRPAGTAPEMPPPIDPTTKSRLRALGYLE